MMANIAHWIEAHPGIGMALALFSLASFLGSLLFLPWLAARIPTDYFDERRRRTAVSRRHPLIHVLLIAAKNLLGWLLILAGLLMLVLPGQGMLTLLMGILLIDFPGKYRLERCLVANPHLFRGLNWLRARRGAPALHLPSTPQHRIRDRRQR
ncbi:MAG: hypothetical protein JXM75_12975 [Chromatiaceae bacterium]|nr:hypothetical protein [Chromatiaceae bacterium]